jgi:polysaccharide biosynthesis protein PslG
MSVAGSAIGATITSAAASDMATPAYALSKADFGLTPGAGFFLDETHLGAGLNDAKNLGVHWIRSTIPWSHFQPTDPRKLAAGEPAFRWKSIDEFIAKVHGTRYAGVFSFIVTVDSPPDWAKVATRIGSIPCAIQAPFDLRSYAFAVAALADHLKNTAHVFELENSPNIGKRSDTHENTVAVWPKPNPCGYAQLLKLTTPLVHALKVGAKTLVGGIGGVKDVDGERIAADNFLADLYRYGARGYFDGVSYHPYSTPYLPCDPHDAICVFNPEPSKQDPYGMKNGWDRMLHARKIMVAKGDSTKSIWITEYGGPTNGPSGSDKVLTEMEQAALLVAGFQRASQYSWVRAMCWFTYDDDSGDPAIAPNGTFMGLLRADHTRKPAYSFYQSLTASAS